MTVMRNLDVKIGLLEAQAGLAPNIDRHARTVGPGQIQKRLLQGRSQGNSGEDVEKRLFGLRKLKVDQTVAKVKKQLSKAVKKTKGFALQKLIRKIKAADSQTALEGLESRLAVVKGIKHQEEAEKLWTDKVVLCSDYLGERLRSFGYELLPSQTPPNPLLQGKALDEALATCSADLQAFLKRLLHEEPAEDKDSPIDRHSHSADSTSTKSARKEGKGKKKGEGEGKEGGGRKERAKGKGIERRERGRREKVDYDSERESNEDGDNDNCTDDGDGGDQVIGESFFVDSLDKPSRKPPNRGADGTGARKNPRHSGRPQMATRGKNRMGQAARRRLWEMQYGKDANHLKRPSKRPEAVPLQRPTPKPATRQGRPGTSESLHPSWQAKQAAKTKEREAHYQGSKITFSDSE